MALTDKQQALFSGLEGCCNSLLGCPFGTVDSKPQGFFWYTNAFCPFRNCQRFAVIGEEMIIALVAALNLKRGPTAVLRGVILFVIDTIETVLRAWPWPHVGQKRQEILRPAFAHFYAATAI